MDATDRVVCRNPDPRKETTRIPRWKHEAVRRAILRAVAVRPAGVPFGELPRRVRRALSAAQLAELGSVTWHTTVVKLDLEARGEIRRVPGTKPQLVVRSRRPTGAR